MKKKDICPDCKGTGKDEKDGNCPLCVGEGKYYGFEKAPKTKKTRSKEKKLN